MDYNLPGSSIHGIFQARILEWVAISFSRRFAWPRDWTWVSLIVGRPFTVWAMWELDYKESWAPRNWCFWTVVLEKTLESPLDSKEIQPVHPKRCQSWIFIGRTDAEAETPILWSPDVKNWLIGKDPDVRKDWRREEKGNNRGWDGWTASPNQWTWVWVNSRSWWWIGRPGVLQSMGSQRVRHGRATELNWTDIWSRLFNWLVTPNNFFQCACCLGEGNTGSIGSTGSPLQYSCLENPMDRGAW